MQILCVQSEISATYPLEQHKLNRLLGKMKILYIFLGNKENLPSKHSSHSDVLTERPS